MDISTTLKIAGIIISIALAIWRIKSSKKLKDKVGLSLLTHTSFPLLTTFQHRFESINIEFTLPVKTNVFYYKGCIFNSGTLDIDKIKIYKPLTISFPEGCKILECKILNTSSTQIEIQKEIEANKLLLSWDLLKPKENFTFDLIIDSESINNVYKLEKGLSTSHRISDLGKVDIVDLSTVKTSDPLKIIKSYLSSLFGSILFIGAIGTFGMITGIKSFIKPIITVENELIYTSTNEIVNVEYLNNSILKIKKGDKVINQINFNNFEKYIRLKPVVNIEKNNYLLIILSSVFIALGLFAFISACKDMIRKLKKGKIIQHLYEINN